MATTTANINIAVNGQQQLERLQSGLDRVNKAFGGLKTQIAGLGFAALGRSAILAADELQDLSDATGIAIGRLIELKSAIQASGGQAEQMPQALNTFLRSMDEAAGGSLKAQNRFRSLGISLENLRTLSDRDLMLKALEGIGKVSDSGRRATLMMDMFGKSFKSVDPRQLADQLKATAGEGDKYAESLRRAAELQNNFEKATKTFQLAFLEAFSPIINLINTFNKDVEKSKDSFDNLVTGIKAVGVALATVFAVQIGTGLVAVIGQIGRGFAAVARLAGVAAGAGIFNATGPHMVALRGIVVVIAAIGTAIAASIALFDDFGDMIENVAARSIEALGNLAAEVLNFPTDAIAGLLNLFGAGIKDPVGLGTLLKMLVENARKAREEYEKTVKARKDAAKPPPKSETTAPIIGRDVDTSELDQSVKKIEGLSDEFDRQNQRVREQIALDTELVGKSKEYQDSRRALIELQKREQDEIKKLTDLRDNLSKDQRDAGLAAKYNEEIDNIKRLAIAEKSRLENLIKLNNQATNFEQFRLFGINRQIELNKQLQSAQDDIAKLGLSEIERKYYDIDAAAKASARSALEAAAAQRGISVNQMSSDEVRRYYEEAAKGTDTLKQKTNQLYEINRNFVFGWREAMRSYVEDATNGAQQAERIFQKATQGMEDAIVQFGKTGKLSFKDFLNSIIEELLRSQARRLIAQTFGAIGGGGGGSGFLGKLLGFANGGIIPTNGPVVVGERGPEILAGAAGRQVIPNGGLGGSVTYNINAVDAASFKEMVARDPSFIYAVSMQGARTVPGGR